MGLHKRGPGAAGVCSSSGAVPLSSTLSRASWPRSFLGPRWCTGVWSPLTRARSRAPLTPLPLWPPSVQRHADVCLDLLGVADCFQGIIAFEHMMDAAHEHGLAHRNKPVLCKPNRQAFEMAMRLASVGDARRAVFLDDSTR